MSGSASGNGAQSASSQVDETSFRAFLNSKEGSGLRYNNGADYGASVLDSAKQGTLFQQTSGIYTLGNGPKSTDVNTLMNAYIAWRSDQGNAQTSWQSYADLVAKEGGGEGNQTILGSNNGAVTPYKSILAATVAMAPGNPAAAPIMAMATKKNVGGV